MAGLICGMGKANLMREKDCDLEGLRSSRFQHFGSERGGRNQFLCPVKDVIPIVSSKDKNFSFSAVARMDSPDIPTPEGANKVVASNAVEVKLNSKLLASVQGFYNDSEIPNTGPLPLKVGRKQLSLCISN